jgi:hypothetical protein
MKFMSNPRFLAIYSGFLTAIFAVTILGGFAGPVNGLRHRGKSRLTLIGQVDQPKTLVRQPEFVRH